MMDYVRKFAMLRKPKKYLPESLVAVFVDNNGLIGLTPRDTLPGDTIWETDGQQGPVIIRRVPEGYHTVAEGVNKKKITELESWTENQELTVEHFSLQRLLLRLLHCHLAFISVSEA
jgi:hypothetical protein